MKDLPFIIGGHDAATILGANPHKTRLQLWGEKLGLISAEDISEKPVIVRGHEMEPYLLELYEQFTGRELADNGDLKPQYTVNGQVPEIPRVHHPDEPIYVSACDGKTIRHHHGQSQLGIVDAKSTSIWVRDKWGDRADYEVIDFGVSEDNDERRNNRRVYPTATEIPLHENIQMQWYMHCEALPFASFAIGIIDDRAYRTPVQTRTGNAIFGLTDFLWCDVERNDGFIESMVRTVDEFVRNLHDRTQPDAILSAADKDTIAKLIGDEEVGTQVALDGGALDLVYKSHQIRRNIKIQQEELDRINAELQVALGNAETGLLPNGNLVTYRTMAEKTITPAPYVRKAKRVLRIPQERHMKPYTTGPLDEVMS